MIKNLYIIEGAAGTGKTYSINIEIEELLKDNKTILYTCYNVNLKEKTRTILPESPNLTVNNIHAYCYDVLRTLNKSVEFEDTDDEEIRQKKYETLLKKFCKIPSTELKYILPIYTDIFIDEAQDFSKLYFKVIDHICNTFDVNLYISGDRFQQINKDYRSKKEPFNIFYSNYFGIDPIIKYLNHNYRTSNPAILNFTNGFLSLNYKDFPEELKYSNNIGDIKNKYAVPEIRWFKNKKLEKEYVLKEISKIPEDKTVAILSRYKRDLIIYEDLFRKSTINSFKGDEADCIFIVGFQDYDKSNYIEKNILYTAFTRVKEKLYVSSAYPRFDLDTYFQSGTYKVKGKQTPIVKPYNKLKTIRENKNFSKEKLIDNNIDSLTVYVSFEDAPFLPYVDNEFIQDKKKSSNQWENRQALAKDHIPYTLRYHKSHKCYSYDFFDLNLLKKNGYTDICVLKFISNIVSEYFDYRISIDKIKLKRLDICKVFHFENGADKSVFKDKLASSLINGKTDSIKNHMNEDLNLLTDILGNFDNNTVYANFQKSKNYTLACYDPSNKINSNKINSKDYFKIELRLKGDCLKHKYANSINNMEKLMKTVIDNRLELELYKFLNRHKIKFNIC